MGLVIQSARPNHFTKKLLKYIFMELDFINIVRDIFLYNWHIL